MHEREYNVRSLSCYVRLTAVTENNILLQYALLCVPVHYVRIHFIGEQLGIIVLPEVYSYHL